MSDLPFMTSKTLPSKRWQYSYLAFFAHGYSPRVHFAARFRFGPAALACCAGKRFAFPQLRTLAGSNPMHWIRKRKASSDGGLTIQWWAMRDVACGFAARFRFGPAALACCAGKRLRVSSAPHPGGFESLCDGPKQKRSPFEDRFQFSGGR